ALPGYLASRRWLGSTGRLVERTRLVESFPLGGGVEIAVVRVEFTNDDFERYALALALAEGAAEAELRAPAPRSLVAAVQRAGAGPAILHDALALPATARTVLELLMEPRSLRGVAGELRAEVLGAGPQRGDGQVDSRMLRADTPTAVVAFGQRHLLRFHRWLEDGISADLEIGRFLNAHGVGLNLPPWTATLTYRATHGGESTV